MVSPLIEKEKAENLKRVLRVSELYRGALPEGYAFCCPRCMVYKARRATLAGIPGILCTGPTSVPEGYDPERLVLCGKFTTEIETLLYKDMRMVEE